MKSSPPASRRCLRSGWLFYSNPALTDGGQSSVRNLLSKLPAGAMLAGFFEVTQ
jgi:hypothetical protein